MKTLKKISLVSLILLSSFGVEAQNSPKANQETFLEDSLNYQNLSPLINYLKTKEFEIDEMLTDSRFEIYNGISNLFKKSPENKISSLDEYKKIIGFEKKRKRIPEFITENHEQLEISEKEYGISKEIISATLGIESNFGEIIGRYNPFNAYVSLFNEGYKKDFAKSQLEELLIFCRKNNLDPLSLKSSYAGAISYAQFIPYSLNKWFVGSDLYDMNNNIMSIANYLSYFKKKTGSLRTAIFRYNPSKLYVQTVLDLAEEAKK